MKDGIMLNDASKADRLQRNAANKGLSDILHSTSTAPLPAKIVASAFGYLEGARDQAAALELRFSDGNSIWFSYHWLGTWRFNPSAGLLLRFSGDMFYMVLIHGSNIDRPLNDGGISLTQGLQDRRVTWIREMTDAEISQMGEAGPTIDGIEVAEFDSQKAVKEWIDKKAPAFRG